MRLLASLLLAMIAFGAFSAGQQTGWIPGNMVGIEIDAAGDVLVVTYDPLTGDSLASPPIPSWWDDPSIVLDGTSAKTTSWSTSNGGPGNPQGDGFIAVLIATNATTPTQALFTYQFFINVSQTYIAPTPVFNCISQAPLMTDLQFIPLSGQPNFYAGLDMTVQPAAADFYWMSIQLPLNEGQNCAVEMVTSAPNPEPLEWSLSAWNWNAAGKPIFASVGVTETESNGTTSYAYAINFAAPGANHPPIPLTGLAAPTYFPPHAPWFSLQLLANDGDDASIDFYLINTITQTVWSVSLTQSPPVQQIMSASGSPFVVPSIPVALTFTDGTFQNPVFLWNNDYKQLLGAAPSNPTLKIKGINLPTIVWGQKLNFHGAVKVAEQATTRTKKILLE